MGAVAAGDSNSCRTGGGGGENDKVEPWTVCESEGGKKKKKKSDGERGVRLKDHDCAGVEETCCWIKFRFITSCMSSRSKVDSSTCGTSTNYGNPSRLGNVALSHTCIALLQSLANLCMFISFLIFFPPSQA